MLRTSATTPAVSFAHSRWSRCFSSSALKTAAAARAASFEPEKGEKRRGEKVENGEEKGCVRGWRSGGEERG